MSRPKSRLTVTVDADLLDAANAAVKAGEVASLSGLVNEALKKAVRKEQLLAAGRAAIADYEAEFGAFTEEEHEKFRLEREKRTVRVRHRRPE